MPDDKLAQWKRDNASAVGEQPPAAKPTPVTDTRTLTQKLHDFLAQFQGNDPSTGRRVGPYDREVDQGRLNRRLDERDAARDNGRMFRDVELPPPTDAERESRMHDPNDPAQMTDIDRRYGIDRDWRERDSPEAQKRSADNNREEVIRRARGPR